jgi:SAM-dependent methyltransferase
MLMAFLRRLSGIESLPVAMTGIKMGDQYLHIGCDDRVLLSTLAAKVGISGRACALVSDEAEAARAEKAARDVGALVEVERLGDRFPYDDGIFDLAVIDNTANAMGVMPPERRVRTLQETIRVLRPGGRVVVIEAIPRGGLMGALTRQRADPHFSESGGTQTALTAEGFSGVRVLAEREGRRFLEGMKRPTSHA